MAHSASAKLNMRLAALTHKANRVRAANTRWEKYKSLYWRETGGVIERHCSDCGDWFPAERILPGPDSGSWCTRSLQTVFYRFRHASASRIARSVAAVTFGLACSSAFAQLNGVGPGTVNYTVEPNTGPTPRTTTATIAGQTFTITQAGCTYPLSPSGSNFGVGAGSGSFGVVPDALTCQWTATSNVSWLTVTGGASGVGQGVVNYAVSKNPGGPKSTRVGTITVANRTFTVTQK